MTTLENKYVKKLILDLESEGIIFSEDQEKIIDIKTNKERTLENLVFEKDGIKIKIYKGLFFREGGLSCITEKSKGDKGDFYKITSISDEFFYEMQKSIIRHCIIGIYE
jgi:hypothetical protein